MTEDRKTYRADHDMRCCWNCRHSFSRFNLSRLCKNSEEWVMEAAVEPVGCCDSWEAKERKEAHGL